MSGKFRAGLVGCGAVLAVLAPTVAMSAEPPPAPASRSLSVPAGVSPEGGRSAASPLLTREPSKQKYVENDRPVTVPEHDPTPQPTGRGAARLISDYDAGRVTPAKLVRTVLALQHRAAFPVAGKYADPTPNRDDLTLLGAYLVKASERLTSAQLRAIRKALPAAPHQVASPGAALTTEDVDCAQHPLYTDRVICEWVTPNFKLSWDQSGPYALEPDQLIDTTPANGIPDWVESLRTGLDDARDFYISIGFGTGQDPNDSTDDPPSTDLSISVSGDPINGNGVSLPPDPFGSGAIRLPVDTTVPYLPAHELFHQFQYAYTGYPLTLSANWFQEASAEWAAGQFLTDQGDGVVPDPATYGRNVPTFLGEPNRRLNDTDGFGGPRQYGAITFIDYFTWVYGDDFVKNVLAQFHNYGAVINEAEAIENTVANYDGDLSYDLPYFWWQMYTMCGDPGQINSFSGLGQNQIFGPIEEQFAAYCDQYMGDPGEPTVTTAEPDLSTPRPEHESQVADDASGTWEPTVGSGGAAFLDFAGPTGATEARRITLNLDVPQDFHGYVNLQPWGDNPADPYSNYSCNGSDGTEVDETGTITISAEVNKDCPNATAMLVATNADSVVENWDLNATWAAQRADTIVTTGEVMIGVDELGSTSSTMDGPAHVDIPEVKYVGLRHIPSGTELASFGAPTLWSALLTPAGGGDEELVNGAWWSDLKPSSFTYSSDHARSQIDVGDRTIIHEYSTTTNPEVIRCDVTIRSTNPLPGRVLYRLGGRAGTDPGGKHSLTATRDPADTEILHMNNLGTWNVDDPSDYYLSPYDSQAPFSGLDYANPQMDIDVSVQGALGTGPSFTFFYAASDLGEAGARADVANLGATSIFSYKLSTYEDVDLPVGFAIGYSS